MKGPKTSLYANPVLLSGVIDSGVDRRELLGTILAENDQVLCETLGAILVPVYDTNNGTLSCHVPLEAVL